MTSRGSGSIRSGPSCSYVSFELQLEKSEPAGPLGRPVQRGRGQLRAGETALGTTLRVQVEHENDGVVEASSLQRRPLFGDDDGLSSALKAEAARRRRRECTPFVTTVQAVWGLNLPSTKRSTTCRAGTLALSGGLRASSGRGDNDEGSENEDACSHEKLFPEHENLLSARVTRYFSERRAGGAGGEPGAFRDGVGRSLLRQDVPERVVRDRPGVLAVGRRARREVPLSPVVLNDAACC